MLTDAVMEAVKKNLNAEVGAALQSELAELDALRSLNNAMEHDILNRKAAEVEYVRELTDLKKQARGWEVLNERASELERGELRISLLHQEIKLLREAKVDLLELIRAGK